VAARKSKDAKTKAVANRTLESITGEIHAALKHQTANIMLVGALLVEANEHVEHGKWLPWLQQEFDLSERTAHRYMKVARLVAKSATVADLNLSPSALYVFADEADECDDDDMAAILKVAATTPERITKSRAQKIVENYFAELYAAEDAKEAAAKAKRLAWEAKNPERAKEKARDEFIRQAMEDDMDDAKQNARQNGEPWGDIKDEWIKEWIADNWSEDQEAEFEAEWKESWGRDHGAEAIEAGTASESSNDVSASAEAREAKYPAAEQEADARSSVWTNRSAEEEKAAEASRDALEGFKVAVDTLLPQMSADDARKAIDYFEERTSGRNPLKQRAA
jgi:Protein of unknown function (DUF3102)